jgi:hypothetical protein
MTVGTNPGGLAVNTSNHHVLTALGGWGSGTQAALFSSL